MSAVILKKSDMQMLFLSKRSTHMLFELKHINNNSYSLSGAATQLARENSLSRSSAQRRSFSASVSAAVVFLRLMTLSG